MTRPALGRADATRLAIFLDFDGCLVDIASRPQDVVVPKALPPTLHRLWRRSGGALALVSGRPVAELRRFFPGLPVPLCGSHGAERAMGIGKVRSIPVDQVALAAAADLAEASLMTQDGLLLERKPVGLGLHYRGAPDRAAVVQGLAAQLVSGLPGFHAHQGKLVVEVRPDGIGKGHAVRELMRVPPFRGRRAVMFGDDATDEPAFAAVNRLKGLSVKVGSGSTCARHRIADPSGVRRLLACWSSKGDAP